MEIGIVIAPETGKELLQGGTSLKTLARAGMMRP
jgi:hypothetical protein